MDQIPERDPRFQKLAASEAQKSADK